MDSSHSEHSTPKESRPARAQGCELTLVKGRHTWRFRCEHAEEPSLLSVISEVASTPGVGLDQFDLAVIASQLQRHFAADHEYELRGEQMTPSESVQTVPNSPARPARPGNSIDSTSHQAT